MHKLNIRWSRKTVDLSVVLSILNLLWIHIRSNTKPTFLGELQSIATDTTKGIKDIWCSVSKLFRNSLSDMLGHGFRSDWIPWFVIYLNPSVKLAEQKVPLFPKFGKFWIFRLQGLLILKIISFRSFITIEVIFVWLKHSLGSFDHNAYIFFIFVFNAGKIDLIYLILFDWQFEFVVIIVLFSATSFLLVSIILHF